MSDLLDTLDIQTQDQVNYSIIWMHGLGADAHDFAPLVPELHFPESIGVRFVFPNAPVRPITINNGYPMRAWFDILSLARIESQEDEKGLYESMAQINALIEREKKRGVPSDHIFLAGFSQGCAMALLTGLRYPEKLAGIIGLSGYLPLYQRTAQEASAANKATPIFLVHGQYDAVIPLSIAQKSRDTLLNLAYPLQWHEYPMEHQVCAQEVQDLNAFLHQCMTNA